MAEKREFEGIGSHACDCTMGCHIEYISVDKWVKRPDDVKGQSLDVGKLIPSKLKVDQASCGKHGREYYVGDLSDCPYPHKGDIGVCQPPRFRFRITVETEEVSNRAQGETLT